jgi:hypothetical protein
MTSIECFARADRIIQKYVEWKSTNPLDREMDDISKISTRLYNLRFDRYIQLLNVIYDMCKGAPMEELYRKMLMHMCDNEPTNPITDAIKVQYMLPIIINTGSINVTNVDVNGTVNGNITQNTTPTAIANTKEKRISNKKFARRWIRNNRPTMQHTTNEYYELYVRAADESTDNDPLPKIKFWQQVESFGYMNRKVSQKSGRHYWIKIDTEDSE